jgi:RNA polymerase sigma-70 factor (ECF subfamily)
MSEDVPFADLIRRVRAGDPDAAAAVVRLYEPEIRRIARVRLSGSSLRELLDSADICQSVLANFFVRAASGQFELTSPEQLLHLLVTMTCNKFNDRARRQKARKRGEGLVRTGEDEAMAKIPDPGADPSHTVAMRDLLETLRSQLTEEERYLADQRALGHDWPTIAAKVGAKPEALRKRLARGLDRVGKQLGLEEVDDE